MSRIWAHKFQVNSDIFGDIGEMYHLLTNGVINPLMTKSQKRPLEEFLVLCIDSDATETQVPNNL